jgi:hypothetical protein
MSKVIHYVKYINMGNQAGIDSQPSNTNTNGTNNCIKRRA